MCLVYNVVCSSPEDAPDLKAFTREDATQETLRVVSEQWRESASPPRVLGYSLDHAYTLNQYGFDDLKGRDRVVATVIRDAKGEDGSPLFDARLVVFSLGVDTFGYVGEGSSYEVVAVMDQDGKEVAKADWNDLLYVGEDGLFRTFEDLSEAQQTKVNQDDDSFHPNNIGKGESDVLYSMFQRGWFEEKDKMEVRHVCVDDCVVIALWYRSAALVFKPAKSDDSSSSDDDNSGDSE